MSHSIRLKKKKARPGYPDPMLVYDIDKHMAISVLNPFHSTFILIGKREKKK